MYRSQPATAETTDASKIAGATTQATTTENQGIPTEFDTAQEQIAYKTGFADGFTAADSRAMATEPTTRTVAPTTRRVVYRNSASRSAPRRVYYDYNRPQGRSFWQKHRDKLTLAIGTGAGAAVGGVIGGKKGAAIGALSGLGGSALYTYKLRKRDRNY
jgi:hypothetical protein